VGGEKNMLALLEQAEGREISEKVARHGRK
jgi:hypothetical protein